MCGGWRVIANLFDVSLIWSWISYFNQIITILGYMNLKIVADDENLGSKESWRTKRVLGLGWVVQFGSITLYPVELSFKYIGYSPNVLYKRYLSFFHHWDWPLFNLLFPQELMAPYQSLFLGVSFVEQLMIGQTLNAVIKWLVKVSYFLSKSLASSWIICSTQR